MISRDIFITAFDLERLEELIATASSAGGYDRDDLDELAAELRRAKVVASKDVPPSVVTMNSRVLLRDLDSAETMEYTLVFPEEADISSGAISILAPIGTAILGFSVGDLIEWPVPSGLRRISIEKILYQPEAAGDFDR